jgi:hypothetical protein
MEKYDYLLNEYKDKRNQIKEDAKTRIALYSQNDDIADWLKKTVQAYNGKVFNKKLTDQFADIQNKVNANLEAARAANRVCIRTTREKRYRDQKWVLQIEIQNRPQACNYTDYESTWIEIELTDYTNGRVLAESWYYLPANTSNKQLYIDALSQVDAAVEPYSQLLKAVEAFEDIPLHLRKRMRIPYTVTHG